jgi:hypothetical protein
MIPLDFMKLVSGNEQDRAECEQWWRETTHEDKAAVWAVIQRRYRDPRMEVMARFAQMAFGMMIEQAIREQEGQGK